MGWTEGLIGMGGRTVSGEKTRGDGGCRRGEESAMAEKGGEIDSRRQQRNNQRSGIQRMDMTVGEKEKAERVGARAVTTLDDG